MGYGGICRETGGIFCEADGNYREVEPKQS